MTQYAQTWVLLHGLTRQHRHWVNFPQTLQQHYPASRIITPDLPGNGDHADIVSPLRIHEMLLDVRRDIAAPLADGPVHIIGLSMGGMVAIDWMKSFPQECVSGTLINTSVRGVSPFYHRLRPKNYVRILHTLFSRNDESRERIFLAMTSNLNPDNVQLLRQWVSYAKANRVSPGNAVRQLLASIRYGASGPRPPVPVLVLSSENDNMVNPQCSASLARRWDVPLEMHPLAGHDLPLDDGEWVCNKVSRWLSGIS